MGLRHRGYLQDACIVNEDVETTEGIQGSSNNRFTTCNPPNIAVSRHKSIVSSKTTNCFGHSLACTSVYGHASAGIKKSLGRSSTDPPGSPGYKHCSVSKIHAS
jgi:hypothetical protein